MIKTEQAKKKFRELKNKASNLKENDVDKFLLIKDDAQHWITKTFENEDSEFLLNKLNSITYDIAYLTSRDRNKINNYFDLLMENIGLLERKPRKKYKVFIVHGHNKWVLDSVEGLLRKLELDPIILAAQPNRGITVIQKFLKYSDVHFAIVLFTADDLGRSKNEIELKPRARQNVLFELGYFVCRLGMENVCVLYETGVEILSDYKNVLFIPIDNEGIWKSDLAKELKAAIIEVDLNKLYS